MAARSSNRASKGFYKALNNVSTADFLKNGPVAKRGPFYEIERVLSHRRIRGKVRKYFFILYRCLINFIKNTACGCLNNKIIFICELKLHIQAYSFFRMSILFDGKATVHLQIRGRWRKI